jgi:hypothetical protein
MSANLDLLISKTDVANYAQISANVNEEKYLQPHILHAQNIDLKPVFGSIFWTDLILNRADDNYKQLLDGGEYVVDGKTKIFQGLKAAIALFSYSRYISSKNIVDTNFGLVTKDTDVSSAVDLKSKQFASQQARAAGQVYLSEAIEYIEDNISIFTLYASNGNCKTIAKTIPNLSSISRF